MRTLLWLWNNKGIYKLIAVISFVRLRLNVDIESLLPLQCLIFSCLTYQTTFQRSQPLPFLFVLFCIFSLKNVWVKVVFVLKVWRLFLTM